MTNCVHIRRGAGRKGKGLGRRWDGGQVGGVGGLEEVGVEKLHIERLASVVNREDSEEINKRMWR